MTELPRYGKPPITEVAISVQFESLEGFQIPHLGLLWEKFRKEFPNCEQHGLIENKIERLRPSIAERPEVSFLSNIETPRVWFVSENGAELIQVQPNRFVRNWRKTPTEDSPYPHYEDHIRPSFIRDFELFQEALVELGLPKVSINQCEVTYVNNIFPNDVWNTHDDIGKVLKIIATDADQRFGPDFEHANVMLAQKLRDEAGDFIGRLRFDLKSAFRMGPGDRGELTPIFTCSLIARGNPASNNSDSHMQFIDRGRRQIVELFEKMFTDAMQEAWHKVGED